MAKKLTYKTAANLVARILSIEELKELAVLLDEDKENDFCFFIQKETANVAPELYASVHKNKKEV